MNPDVIELGTILIICLGIIAGIQWFLLRFTHWSIALGATAFISLFIAFVYVSLGNASPNGSGSGADFLEYLIPMIVVFAVLFGVLFAIANLTKTQIPKTQIPKKALLCIAGFIAVVFIGIYTDDYIENATTYQEIFSNCEIKLTNKSGNTLVSEITFKNTSNSLVSTINPNNNEQPYPSIPRDTDKIIFTCYSDKTGMFMQDFPIDYSLLQEKDGEIIGLCFWLRMKVVSPIKIVMNPNNKVDLYINNKLVQQYQLSKEDISNKNAHKGKYK